VLASAHTVADTLIPYTSPVFIGQTPLWLTLSAP
jgi:hypothetical protein